VKLRAVLLVLIWAVLALVIGLAIADAVLAPTPSSNHPDFIDTVLASRAVVAAIRLAIIFAAAFVVLSVVALVAERRWLRRVGPVEVSSLDAENQQLKEELAIANRAIEDLRRNAAYWHQVVDRGPSA
jgi:hypothetical protein